MLAVLVPAGLLAVGATRPLAFLIAVLLIIVTFSYRQTIRAYPQGGGAYIVAKDNLGIIPGLIAATALLIDYVLTVSVSVAAGVAAVVSAAPTAGQYRVALAAIFIAIIGWVICEECANRDGCSPFQPTSSSPASSWQVFTKAQPTCDGRRMLREVARHHGAVILLIAWRLGIDETHTIGVFDR
jgi:hypothetical protein